LDKRRSWWAKHRPSTRRLVQLYAALLYNAHLKGFVQGEIYTGGTKGLCVPGLNCYSCPAAVGACPLGALQNAVAASAKRPAFYAVGVLLLFGLTLGRTICGWLCPFGLLQELLHKLPGPKLKKGRLTRALSWIKYVLLAVLTLAVPLYFAFRRVPLPAFCKYICPAGTLEGAVALLLHPANGGLRAMLGPLFAGKLTVLLLILAACVFIYRAFCRFLCPLGAIYSLMTRLALVGVKLDETRCTDCGLCKAVCPVDIRRVGDRECVACGKCISKCPEAAISFKVGKKAFPLGKTGLRPAAGFNVVAPAMPAQLTSSSRRCPSAHIGSDERSVDGAAGKIKRRSLLAWALVLIVLLGALVYFNNPAKSDETITPTETQPADLGNVVGQTLPDFTVQTLDGGTFTLSAHRGEVVILNLWATWCGPCVRELPIFEAFAAARPDVSVLAVHGPMITEDVSAWLAEADLDLPFAVDADGALTALLGASNVLPHTVVLDRTGAVIYNAPGSITAELLEELYRSNKE
jgi:polyferredoxin/peroxiredoxin